MDRKNGRPVLGPLFRPKETTHMIKYQTFDAVPLNASLDFL